MEPKFNPNQNPREKPKKNEPEEEVDASDVETMLESAEESVFEKRQTISNWAVAMLERELEKAERASVDLTGIKDLESRVARLKQEAGKVAVRSCLEKAQHAARAKDTDPLRAAYGYYETIKKLEECKDSISSSEIELIQAEINDLEADLRKTLDDNGYTDFDTVAKKEEEQFLLHRKNKGKK